METGASEYALTAILSIITEEKEVHLVAFYSCMFKAAKLSYNTYDKELFAVFKAFYIWCYYLEGSELSIDIILNYKNLEYFLTTKIFSHC